MAKKTQTTNAAANAAETLPSTRINDTDVIRFCDSPKGIPAGVNPKVRTSDAWLLFEMYKPEAATKQGLTVGAYVKRVLASGNTRRKAGRVAVAWDKDHGFITVTSK